tara:strand:- start:121 stop:987 length:867 start_codon:yes stop_codon:yes gene_type:complete
MAYIGKEPIVGNFQKCDAITVVNGQAAYTLQVSSTNVTPESSQHCLVSLNGILQAPVTSFTVSGSTLTFASNLATGDVIDFVILLGNVLDLGTPSDGTVTNAKLAQDIISGETALTSEPASTDEFLVSDAGTLKRIDYSLISNRPAFSAYLGSDQTITDGSFTKIEFNTEVFDSDGTYDNSSNYRWTPGVAGKSMITTMVWAQGGSDNTLRRNQTAIYKNGSLFASSIMNTLDAEEHHRASGYVSIIDSHDDNDYYEVFCSADVSSGTVHADADAKGTWFSAFKLIGV